MNFPNHDSMVIIGAGHSGGRAVQALRAQGWTGRIDLIGLEAHAPYERPPLSKELLLGAKQADDCLLGPVVDSAHDSALQRHVATATRIDRHQRTVTLASGEQLPYRALLLATGGHARHLAVPGADLPQVMALRTLDDAARLAPHLAAGKHLLVVGGGFIGLEVAASARQRGVEVTLLEGAPRLMGRAVPADMAEQALQLHRARGVDVRLGVVPERFEALDGKVLAHLTDGSQLRVDAVVVGIGIQPATELAAQAGLTVARGIVVDAGLRTNDPQVFAIGDVSEFPSPISGDLIRQETWLNAETQGQVAATNMLGGNATYTQAAWFWSDQYDHQLQVAGEPALGVQTVRRPLPEGDVIEFYLNTEGRVVGMSGWGLTSRVTKELKLARMLTDRRVVAAPALLADPATKLKGLLSGG